jgi:chromosome partitioning protein
MTNLVIAILGDKGGIGKSTLGTNLLRRIIDDEPSAILIDCDSDQHSSAALMNERKANKIKPNLTVENIPNKFLEKKVKELAQKYKIIIIEFGKAMGDLENEERLRAVRLASKLADKILMPLQPTFFDSKTIEKIEKKLIDLKLNKVPALIVPNRVMSKKQLSGLTGSEPYLQYFKISKAFMKNRICYSEVNDNGRTIFDIKPQKKSEKDALQESEQLFQEIFYGS